MVDSRTGNVNTLILDDPLSYKKRTCCGKPELTVFVSGSIKGIKHGPHECEIRFSNATYFKTKRIVEYINTSRPRPAYTPTSSSSQTDEKKLVSLKQSLQNKSQYALYDNGEGNSAKRPNLTIGENGMGITEIENNLSTKFEVNVNLPRMVCTDYPVNVNVEYGITTAKLARDTF
ncbi:13360_t:CDS:2 [Funneliformis caledonium]|uniref:13360_t:CDS:1 n=1 Tax=Funneliformis caledonium TaxID=1117310 RepID=A0A9N9GQP4_9GLOM|nr:13360_t:CDS:2 [Funneliformis caledonium]